MGIGDWGLGIGDWGLGPIPNPQSPRNINYNNFNKIYTFSLKKYIIKILNKRKLFYHIIKNLSHFGNLYN